MDSFKHPATPFPPRGRGCRRSPNRITPRGSTSNPVTVQAGGQSADLDFDNAGVANGVEFFMGQTGSGFTANPPLVGNTPTWTEVTGSAVANGSSVSYTLPTGNPKLFYQN